MNNSYHIAANATLVQLDIDGAEIVLKENIELAKSYRAGEFLKNAWQDYLMLCENHPELTEKGIQATEELFKLAKDDSEKGYLICDKADLFARKGNLEAAELEYQKLFATLPDNDLDGETHDEAISLLEDLGEDTTLYEHLF